MDGGMMVDENGLPIMRPRPAQPDPYADDQQQMEVDPEDRPQPPRLDQQWIDDVLGRDRDRDRDRDRQRQQQPAPPPAPRPAPGQP